MLSFTLTLSLSSPMYIPSLILSTELLSINIFDEPCLTDIPAFQKLLPVSILLLTISTPLTPFNVPIPVLNPSGAIGKTLPNVDTVLPSTFILFDLLPCSSIPEPAIWFIRLDNILLLVILVTFIPLLRELRMVLLEIFKLCTSHASIAVLIDILKTLSSILILFIG